MMDDLDIDGFELVASSAQDEPSADPSQVKKSKVGNVGLPPQSMYPSLDPQTGYVASTYIDEGAEVIGQAEDPPRVVHPLPFSSASQVQILALPFALSQRDASERIRKWKLNKWHIPVDYLESMQAGGVKSMLVPFDYFSCSTLVKYSAQMGQTVRSTNSTGFSTSLGTSMHSHRPFGRKYSQRPFGRKYSHGIFTSVGTSVKTTENVNWSTTRGEFYHQHNNVPVCAWTDPTLRKLLLELGGFSLRDEKTVYTGAEFLCAGSAWELGWAGEGQQKVKAQAKDIAKEKIRLQYPGSMMNALTVAIEYGEIHQRRVYVPVFVNDHEYKGKIYSIVVHGQNGKVGGDRPYGLSSLRNIGVKLVDKMRWKKDKMMLLDGANLNSIDQCKLYQDESIYVVFPSSTSVCGKPMVGHIILENVSDHFLHLSSQERKTKRMAGKYDLPPRQRGVFDYCGYWTIRVDVDKYTNELLGKTMTPLQNLVKIKSCDPTQSGSEGDLLGMRCAFNI